MSLLQVSDLHVHYGSVHAVKGVSFEIHKGEIVSLIGANGAGKTSVLRALSGICSNRGRISFRGKDLTKVPPHERILQGLSQSPEGRGVFSQMTVKENLMMGAFRRRDKEIEADLEKNFEIFPKLKQRLPQIAGTLSGGEQQMLAVARALMARPKLLLLDEPSLGLAPLIVAQIFQTILKVNSEGVSVLLVEQNAKQALQISSRAYVLETGCICQTGSGRELLSDDSIRKAYLGISL